MPGACQLRMLSTVAMTIKMGVLLAFRPRVSSSYSQYACGARGLQRFALHPILSVLGVSFFSFLMFFPEIGNAQVCIDSVKLPGVQSTCASGSPAFPSVMVDPNTNNPLKSFLVTQCPSGQSCAVETADALCSGLAKNAGKSMAYGCVDGSSCPTGRVALEAAVQPEGGACGAGRVCCTKTASSSAPTTPGTPVELPDPLGGISIPELIGNLIRTFAGIAGAIALLMFIHGGVMWILSGGNDAKVKNAQVILRNACIGLILIFGAYFFTSAIIGAILANP